MRKSNGDACAIEEDSKIPDALERRSERMEDKARLWITDANQGRT
jgi:hypothetical protein